MKKNILFAAYTLDVGGTEAALVNLINILVKKYDVTLVLEKKQGTFLNNINKQVNIMEYNPNENKNVIIRKTVNMLKRIKFIIKYKNKFDFGASFATYSKMGSFCARTASNNNALWVHTDYLTYYNNNEVEVKKFFDFVEYNKFKNIFCVSEMAKLNLEKSLKRSNIQVVKNLIDYQKILTNAKEKPDIKRQENITTFINVSRHEEKSKRITRIIEASEKLQRQGFDFRVLLIGTGENTKDYKKMVQDKKLEKCIFFLGQKNNPYPYFTISDYFLLTSDVEGYPVVFNECMVLNLPIITTDVSDAKKDIEGIWGIVTKKDINSIYETMKEVTMNGYKIQNKFEPLKYNNEIIDKLERIINGGYNA